LVQTLTANLDNTAFGTQVGSFLDHVAAGTLSPSGFLQRAGNLLQQTFAAEPGNSLTQDVGSVLRQATSISLSTSAFASAAGAFLDQAASAGPGAAGFAQGAVGLLNQVVSGGLASAPWAPAMVPVLQETVTDGLSGTALGQNVVSFLKGAAAEAPAHAGAAQQAVAAFQNALADGAAPQILAALGAHFVLSAPASSTAGKGFAVTVTVRDAFGHRITGYTGSAAFSSSDPKAGLPSTYAFMAADQGRHTFTLTLDTAGGRKVTVTDAADGIRSHVTVHVTPAAAMSLVVRTATQTTVGSAVGLTLTALDAYGNVCTGYTGSVHFASSGARAALPADYVFTRADAGVHTFRVTLATVGSQWVTATDTVNLALSARAALIERPATPKVSVRDAGRGAL
jgi:hypothetical protein